MTMSMAERWAADEELADELNAEGKGVWQVDPGNKPRWVADGLDQYGPDAPHQDPPTDLLPPTTD